MFIKVNNKQEEIELLQFLEKNNYFYYKKFEELYNNLNKVDYNDWYFYLYDNKFSRGYFFDEITFYCKNTANIIGFTTAKKFLRLKKLEKCT